MWQRFTERARRVILMAQQEAGNMKAPRVGTEHILLGLTLEDAGLAAHILQQLEIGPEKVRVEIERGTPPESKSISEEPKLTVAAKRVLEMAAEEGRRLNHKYIGSEHLLLALLLNSDGLGATILNQLGLNLETARTQILEHLGPDETMRSTHLRTPEEQADHRARMPRSLPQIPPDVAHFLDDFLAPGAREVLMRAAAECILAGQERVGIEHLLLAMLRGEQADLLRNKIGSTGELKPGK